MRAKFDLAIRHTHKWADHCSHMDDWGSIGTYSILNIRTIKEAEDFDQLDTVCITVRVDSKAHRNHVAVALRDSLSGGGCDHEHDCCGCPTWYSGDVKYVGGKEYTLIQHGYRNY